MWLCVCCLRYVIAVVWLIRCRNDDGVVVLSVTVYVVCAMRCVRDDDDDDDATMADDRWYVVVVGVPLVVGAAMVTCRSGPCDARVMWLRVCWLRCVMRAVWLGCCCGDGDGIVVLSVTMCVVWAMCCMRDDGDDATMVDDRA